MSYTPRQPEHKALTSERARAALGRQIRQLRELRKRSASTLAGQVGASAALMHRMQRGQRLPAPLLIVKIARALQAEPGVAAEWLWLLHPVLRVQVGRGLAVWAETPMPDGRTVADALKAADGKRGRRGPRIDPRGFSRALELQLGPKAFSASRAWRVVRFEARQRCNRWAWEGCVRTFRRIMQRFFLDFPELNRTA